MIGLLTGGSCNRKATPPSKSAREFILPHRARMHLVVPGSVDHRRAKCPSMSAVGAASGIRASGGRNGVRRRHVREVRLLVCGHDRQHRGQTLEAEEQLHPHLQWLEPTISYSQSAAMRNRASFTGPSELRRSLDYSGQTYWFSTDIRQLLGSRAPRYWPSLLRLSAGHSITDYVDPITAASHYHFPSLALQLSPGVRGISWYR